jgi:RNA polymerase sigma-70 factor (ECF subfamily)
MLFLVQDVESETDGTLARSVSEGDRREAEAELVRRFHRRVHLYGLRHLGGDEARAADLAQDVLMLVIERLRAGEVREPDKIGSFILGTARMMVWGEVRRRGRDQRLEAGLAGEVATSVAPVERVDVDRLSESLMQLTERQRTVVLLSFVSEQDAAEIAEVVGTTAGNVRVLRHRAVARLAELMNVEVES